MAVIKNFWVACESELIFWVAWQSFAVKFTTVARARSRGRGLEAIFCKGACIIRVFSYYVALECLGRGVG
jgi:hypothetical protein